MKDFLIITALLLAGIYFLFGAYIGIVDKNFGAKIYSFLQIPQVQREDLLDDKEFLLNLGMTGVISLIGALAIFAIFIFKILGRFY